ncbi:uncharacterized protein EV422DRAFT_566644 [Fimicolochytrium jonesii]|uniref:uncharacterized protein n=1 Tax=Fimicolochytrium jonesii TaxID=1396493 RepID=UPI0022FDE652|nr:uncharacterized protein EV422DRAFT_566644 [Fimicolochytrium jonesii]KAI8822208.1 hypothetical protein EV422DRAFT_566644 [Fimicolochytrium jonesii]
MRDARSPLSSNRTPSATHSAPGTSQEHLGLIAEKWNPDSKEKKKGFMSHLFGRRKEKPKEADMGSDSSTGNYGKRPDEFPSRNELIDPFLGGVLPPKPAGMSSFTKRKQGKTREGSSSDKQVQLDLAGFSMDPAYVPLDLVSINSPLESANTRNFPGGELESPGMMRPGAAASSISPNSRNNMNLTSPALSTWQPPESWGTRVEDRLPGKLGPTDGPRMANVDANSIRSAASYGQPNPILYRPHEARHDDIAIDTRYEVESIKESIAGDKVGALRLFRRDGTFATVSCRESTTAGELLMIMAKKSLISDFSKFNIHIARNGTERVLARHERPHLIQRRLFEQLGYTRVDKIEFLGREDHSYLCRFIFKETAFGNEISADFWKSSAFNPATLSLARMNLSAVPLTIFRFAHEIVQMDLSWNPNIHEIPNDLALTMDSMRSITLARNEISKVPRSLQYITRLSEIDLSYNRIDSLDDTGLGSLTGLTKLRLAGNLLEFVPDDIARGCRRLQLIDLSNNRLTAFPLTLCQLWETLQHLDLNFCRIEGFVPEGIGELRNLMVLRMAGNRMRGGLPGRMADMKELRMLDLRGNTFGWANNEEMPVMEVLATCPKLETLYLDANRIKWIGPWKARSPHRDTVPPPSDFDMFDNDDDISSAPGAAPLEFTSLKYLSIGFQLDLSHARPMMAHFSNYAATLADLNLSSCGIEMLPKRFFQRLPAVLRLNLGGNRLRDLPDFMAPPPNNFPTRLPLQELLVNNNFLEDVPPDIGDLDRLVVLDLKSNYLRELPSEIWRCRSLKVLNLSSNRLEVFPMPYPEDGTVLVSMNTQQTMGRSGGFSYGKGASGTLSRADHFSQSAQSLNTISDQMPNLPPLSHSLQQLYLSDNYLGDDLYMALYHLPNLQALHVSFNEVTDITSWVVAIPVPVPMVPWFYKLQELHLSGNLITTLPAEIERIRNLKSLFLNANKLSTVPGEVGKLKSLEALDLGSQVGARGEGTGLRYNVSNWPYDWNWNWNLDLKYLNLSGNKRLEIKPSASASSFFSGADLAQAANQTSAVAGHKVGAKGGGAIQAPATSGALVANPSQKRRDLTDFNALTNLRLLGLMDVTCLIMPPDESAERRIRTTGSDMSLLGIRGGVIRYGVADMLSRPGQTGKKDRAGITEGASEGQHPLSTKLEPDNFAVWDLVVPKFRGRDNEALFAVFDGKGTRGGAKMAKYLNEWFGWFLTHELEKVERVEPLSEIGSSQHVTSSASTKPPNVKGPTSASERSPESHFLDPESIRTALRRTFIAVNRELGSMHDDLDEGLGGPQLQHRSSNEGRRQDQPRNGTSRSNKRTDSYGIRPLYGASALVVFLYGQPGGRSRGAKCSMYIANVGDSMAVISKAGGVADILAKHHAMDFVAMSKLDPCAPLGRTPNFDAGPKSAGSDSLSGRLSLDGDLEDPSLLQDDSRYPWPRSELERVHNASGWFSPSGLVQDQVELTRAFGYFPLLGPVNANPSIQTVELDVDQDPSDDTRRHGSDLRLPRSAKPGEDDIPESPATTASVGGDEFVVLASGAVWEAARCGGSDEDGAQMMVDIARSALAPSAAGTGMGGNAPNTGAGAGLGISGGPGMTKSSSNLAAVQQQSTKSSGGWGIAAMKVRDVALSLSGGKAGGGYLVMVLGLRDLAKKSTWWNASGARRGSAESSIESLAVEDRHRKITGSQDYGSTVSLKEKRRKGTEDPLEMLTKEIAPPVGRLALVFTDIKNSTSIWENNPVAMRAALKLHHQVMRRLLRQTGGYEVKTEGDAFMVSFQNVIQAVEWCLTVQGELLSIDWPAEILSTADGMDIWWQKKGGSEFVTGAGLEHNEGETGSDVEVDMTDDDTTKPINRGVVHTSRKRRELIFRGLSVRMGIHFGNPLCEVDPITSRMDYYGPMVNRAARVEGASQGGQILISSDAMKELKKSLGWWYKDTVEGALTDAIKSGEDLTDNITVKGDTATSTGGQHAHGHPMIAGPNDDAARLKRLGVVTWCIGEIKLKGLETPEVIYAIYRRDLFTRHRFYSLEQSGGLNLMTQAQRKSDDAIGGSLLEIDRATVQSLGALCLRLEYLASQCGDGWQDSSSSLDAAPESLDGEWAVEGIDEGDRPALIKALEHIVTRIENAISIVHLTDSAFSRAIQSLGAAIDTDPSHVLRAIQLYADKLEERKQRKAEKEAAKELRREQRRQSKQRQAEEEQQLHSEANNNGGGGRETKTRSRSVSNTESLASAYGRRRRSSASTALHSTDGNSTSVTREQRRRKTTREELESSSRRERRLDE